MVIPSMYTYITFLLYLLDVFPSYPHSIFSKFGLKLFIYTFEYVENVLLRPPNI